MIVSSQSLNLSEETRCQRSNQRKLPVILTLPSGDVFNCNVRLCEGGEKSVYSYSCNCSASGCMSCVKQC